jgi:hypothetical protein
MEKVIITSSVFDLTHLSWVKELIKDIVGALIPSCIQVRSWIGFMGVVSSIIFSYWWSPISFPLISCL